jgi:membrane-associated PAP2 superfamily phosphatase
MEASGTPTPPTQPAATAPPPPPPPTAPGEEKASGGWRALGIVLALALAFAAAVMIVAMVDIGDTPTCDDVLSGEAALPSDRECFDGSSGQKTASLVLGWPSGVLAGVAALFALYFAATGRRGRTLMQLVGVALVLGALSIGIGSI